MKNVDLGYIQKRRNDILIPYTGGTFRAIDARASSGFILGEARREAEKRRESSP